MRNSIKVAKWEFNRNIKNKSFVISLFLTPLLFVIFAFAPTFFSNLGDDDANQTKVYVNDQIGVTETIQSINDTGMISWDLEETQVSPDEMKEQLAHEEEAAYILFDEQTIESGQVTYMIGEDVGNSFKQSLNVLQQPIKQLQLEQSGLSADQMQMVASPIQFNLTFEGESNETVESSGEVGIPYEKIIPAIFAGLVLFSIVISGMMIFQSASQEKKDKVAEIILSSVTATELMQGKILGYFSLGIFQVTVWLAMALPVASWKLEDVPVFEYLFVPETLLLTMIAVLGYLLFASLFVGLGATVEDYSTSGNFQGMVLMLPFIPFILIGPIVSDPSGIVAQVASYIPFTSPATLLIRLAILDEWPWVEILISLAILVISIWLFMKLAGKIFQVGILIYGKNATPQEIWKWIRA